MLNINVKPLYELGQSFTVMIAGKAYNNIIVTKRTVIANLDKPGEHDILYNLAHAINVANPWTWENIPEKHLTSWLRGE